MVDQKIYAIKMENDEEVEYDENKEKGNQDYYADRRDSLTGRADLF
ncbi:unnamed protein product, partial [Didymodactylos carnosus]